MKRRNFFKLLGIGAVASVVAPKLLIPKEPIRFIESTAPNGIKMTLAYNPKTDGPWIDHAVWNKHRRFTVHVGDEGYKLFHEAMKDYVKQIAVQNGHLSLTGYLNTFK